MLSAKTSSSILVPAPTAWPIIAALGITLIFMGLVTHVAVSIVGMAVLLRAMAGWSGAVLPEQEEVAVLVSTMDQTETQIPKSSLAVEHLAVGIDGHRVRIPMEVHPYWTGLYGGLVGGLAMALVAMLFGIISQRSIWYPINLLAAGILPSLSDAPVEQLREFSKSGLIAGTFIHGMFSLSVGLLYGVSLPMFPRGAGWRSGLVTPVLWSGLLAATLNVINPTLNQRIEWGWFLGSQIAFGLAAGWIVARTEKIETMQSWPLIERAGIEAPRGDADKSDSEERPRI